jgi:3-hydroxyacyl-CoA dehydrogenase, NAD binding domain
VWTPVTPASSAATRPIPGASPLAYPWPISTSSTSPGEMPVPSMSARMTDVARSEAGTSRSVPPKPPTGVRSGSQITASLKDAPRVRPERRCYVKSMQANLRRALVVSGGTIGAGIAQVLLQAGIRVWLSEATPEAADAARARLLQGLTRADHAEAIEYMEAIVGMPAGGPVDLAVAAVPEDMALKQQVLGKMEVAADADALVATNTSSLSINELGGP